MSFKYLIRNRLKMEGAGRRRKLGLEILAGVVLLGAIVVGTHEILKIKGRLRDLQATVAGVSSDRGLLNEAALAQTLNNTVFNKRDPLLVAQKLANIVADKYPPQKSMPGLFPKEEILGAYREIVRTGQNPFICGGAACMLINLCESQGFPARYVGWLSKLTRDDDYD